MNGLCGVALSLLLAASIAAQTATGTVSGTVRDESGGVMPGVALTLRSVATGASRSTTSDTQGRYRIPNVDPGDYELRAELAGFRTAVRSSVVVTVGGTTEADVAMTVGQLAEEVTVQAETPLIEPSKTDLSRVVTTQEIESLPISRPQLRGLRQAVERRGARTRERRRRRVQGARRRRRLGGGAPPVVRRTARAEHDDSGRRRRQRADVHGAAARDAVAGSGQGVPRPQLHVSRRVRPRARRLRQHRDQVGHQPRRRVRSTTSGWTTRWRRGRSSTGPTRTRSTRTSSAGRSADRSTRDRTFFFGNYEGQLREQSNRFSQVVLDNLALAQRRPRAARPARRDDRSGARQPLQLVPGQGRSSSEREPHAVDPLQLPRFAHRQLPRRRRPRVTDVEHRARQRHARSGGRGQRTCRSSRRTW